MRPSSSCWRKPENFGASARLLFEIRREAKNANTITMRIGKAALLKNRLMMKAHAREGESRWRLAVADGRSCGEFLLTQRRDERQIAVPLGVIQPVSDREAVGD